MSTFIAHTVRTYVGKYGGALAETRADDLAASVITAILERSKISAGEIDEVIFGAANQSGDDNRNLARMALLLAGMPNTVPGYTVNRLCASGLQAIASAHESIVAGRNSVVIAGGAESMTRAPWVSEKPSKAWAKPGATFDSALGWRFINPKMAKHDDGRTVLSLGEATEKLAGEYKISRKESDEWAAASHQRATAAWESGFFTSDVMAVPGSEKLTIDETIRPTTTLEALTNLKSSFSASGVITAGNASPLSDGASAVLVASDEALTKHGLTSRAQILGYHVAGVAPYQFGIGPVPAIRKLLEAAGMSIGDIDAIEINEAFAAQTLACIKELKLDPDKVNTKGGAIALGHPLGSSGSRLIGTLIKRLEVDNLEFGIASLCIGVGQGAAMLIRRT
jgi:acetyl-CoA acetyltransferase family protein